MPALRRICFDQANLFGGFTMKKFVIAAAIVAASAAAVHAGSPEMATMDPVVVMDHSGAASSGSSWIIPLILLALLVAAGL